MQSMLLQIYIGIYMILQTVTVLTRQKTLDQTNIPGVTVADTGTIPKQCSCYQRHISVNIRQLLIASLYESCAVICIHIIEVIHVFVCVCFFVLASPSHENVVPRPVPVVKLMNFIYLLIFKITICILEWQSKKTYEREVFCQNLYLFIFI